jgi:hypothetical protein
VKEAADNTGAVFATCQTDITGGYISQSIFGGGNRGDENAANATIPTVVGDTEVYIKGLESADRPGRRR